MAGAVAKSPGRGLDHRHRNARWRESMPWISSTGDGSIYPGRASPSNRRTPMNDGSDGFQANRTMPALPCQAGIRRLRLPATPANKAGRVPSSRVWCVWEEALCRGYEDDPPAREQPQNGSAYDREGERDRHSRDRDFGGRDRERRHHRDRERGDRGGEKEKEEGRYDRDRDHHHRKGGHHDRKHHKRQSRSHSRSRGKSREHDHSRSRSRSRSGSEDRRAKRASGFDVPPTSTTQVLANPPGFFPAVMPPLAAFAMPPQTMTQQATRHARQVYVGGLPGLVNEQTIATFFNQVMVNVGGNTAGPGDVVVNVYINQEKKFAFVEMRTVEEASNAMALDGISFQGVSVRVRRPSDYNPSVAANLGPSQPSPSLNLAAVGLTPGAGGGVDGPDRIFVGGLPYYLTEPQIRELLESFGPLRGFDLVKDRESGNSKGYGFCVYQDPNVTDVACAALNGLKMGDRTLTVRRATANGQQAGQDHAHILSLAKSLTMNGVFPDEGATRVLCLKEAVLEAELIEDEQFDEILEDMRDECGKFGTVLHLVIPRPSQAAEVDGVGKVFVHFEDTGAATRARISLNGRKFDGRAVVATYYPEEQFMVGDFSG
ncbi:splicing factor U2af large subunit B isoform X1 [Selaginella moellendorffii]|nr:splicing factor U2af large subunit B isoform X1 [Selaginella moellendorffii]|eukprot:XP_002988368.2 splicing factor U2af large subunit B isoform X1 [Selaginella moellendorffii]